MARLVNKGHIQLHTVSKLLIRANSSKAKKFSRVYLYGSLILNPKGRVYGTTINGGTGGYGTVWRITK